MLCQLEISTIFIFCRAMANRKPKILSILSIFSLALRLRQLASAGAHSSRCYKYVCILNLKNLFLVQRL